TESFVEREPMLTHRVEAAIADDPMLSLAAKNVEVTVTNGVATLRGSVSDQTYRRDIQSVVRSVPGIVTTRDDVEVSLVRDRDDSESDDRIAFSLERALASLPSLVGNTDRITI